MRAEPTPPAYARAAFGPSQRLRAVNAPYYCQPRLSLGSLMKYQRRARLDLRALRTIRAIPAAIRAAWAAATADL